MRVDEAVTHMTKWYLERIIDSFAKDFPKLDEDRARDVIVNNVDELTDSSRIQRQLAFEGHSYSARILQTYILEALLTSQDQKADETDVIERVTEREREILAAASDAESLRYEDADALEIMEAVLDVALEDDGLTPDEFSLIQRLRKKLGVQESSKRILLAQMGHFPQPDNEVHTPTDFRDALKDLQRKGVVFYCNHLDGGHFVIPDEMVPGVKAALGIELAEKPWRLLLSNLSKKHLGTILKDAGVPKSGTKDEQVDRVVEVGVEPTEALDLISNSDLYDICDGLPGVNVSGTKQDKIDRIIDYFDKLVVKDVREEATPGEHGTPAAGCGVDPRSNACQLITAQSDASCEAVAAGFQHGLGGWELRDRWRKRPAGAQASHPGRRDRYPGSQLGRLL